MHQTHRVRDIQIHQKNIDPNQKECQNHNRITRYSNNATSTADGHDSSDYDKRMNSTNHIVDTELDFCKSKSYDDSSDKSVDNNYDNFLRREITCKKKPSSRKATKLIDEIKSRW